MPSTPKEWARDYLNRGWTPIPLVYKDKYPVTNSWTRMEVSEATIENQFPDTANTGLALGPRSNNLLDTDLDDSTAVRLASSYLPATGTVFGRPSKPKSHWLYQAGPDEVIRRKTYIDPDGSMLIEIRGDAHQTMVPPSIHPHGEQLEWDQFAEPGHVTIDALQGAVGRLAAATMLARHWQEWQHRHHTITLALTGGLLRAGWSRETVHAFMQTVCAAGGDDDWRDRENAIASTADKYETDQDAEVTGFPTLIEAIGKPFVDRLFDWLRIENTAERTPNTDHGNALRLIEYFGDKIRWVPNWDSWLVWDSTRWKRDDADQIYTYARQVPRHIMEEALKERDDEKAGALSKWANRSQDVSRINAMIRLGRTDPRIIVDSNDLDKDPWLFNVENGTINLMTGGLQPHDPSDLITKIAPVPYDPQADAPIFTQYLSTILQSNTETIEFLQRMVGYSMTGLNTEQVFTICWGPAGTGKSTLLETLRGIMGDYATHADTSVFLAKQNRGRATPEVARLQGARLVTASETEEGAKMALALVKSLSGGDRMTASNLYAAPFEFDPILKLWIGTNHKPRIPADEEAVWERLVFLPFEVKMRDHPDRIFGLKDILRREYPGILAWAVAGTQLWRRDGLKRPEVSREATTEYKSESDELGDFLEELTIAKPGAKVKASDLYAAYKGWAQAAGYSHPLNIRRFKEKMIAHRYEFKAMTAGNFWMGIDLILSTNEISRSESFGPYGQPPRHNA